MTATVLDANVVIRYLDSKHPQHKEAVDFLVKLASDDLILNDLTLAEILVAPARTNQERQVLETIKEELGITVYDESGEDWAIHVARVRAASNPSLRTPDAIVLATAIRVNGYVGSFDDRLRKAARQAGYLREISPV